MDRLANKINYNLFTDRPLKQKWCENTVPYSLKEPMDAHSGGHDISNRSI